MGKACEKQTKARENRQKTGAFLVLIFLGEKLVGANFYAFCNYELNTVNTVYTVQTTLHCLNISSSMYANIYC